MGCENIYEDYVIVHDEDCNETEEGSVCGEGPDGEFACLAPTEGSCLDPDYFTIYPIEFFEFENPQPMVFCANGEACIVSDDSKEGRCVETDATCIGGDAYGEMRCQGDLAILYCQVGQPLFLDCAAIGSTCVNGFGCIVQDGEPCVPGMSRCDIGLDDPFECPDGLQAGVCPDIV